jgi:hypothetical protein
LTRRGVPGRQGKDTQAGQLQGGAMDLTRLSREALEEYAHNLEAIVAEQDQLLTTLAEAIPETEPTQTT